MKTILCYGDSNTWGYNPQTKKRYPYPLRWTSILQKELGSNYEVIAEGLNARTTIWDDPLQGKYLNGQRFLFTCLHTHKPLDLVIIFLGTNDLKERFQASALKVAQGVLTLVEIVKTSQTGPEKTSPEILVIIPPPLQLTEHIKKFTHLCKIHEQAVQKSKAFSQTFPEVLKNQGHLFAAADFISTSKIDGVHLEAKAHALLGKKIAAFVKKRLFKI